MCDADSIVKILDKYPLIRVFIEDDTGTPLMIKFMTTIFYLRKKIGYEITTEAIFSNLSNINTELFDNVKKNELQDLLKYVIYITCVYVNESDFIETEDKYKICKTIVKNLE